MSRLSVEASRLYSKLRHEQSLVGLLYKLPDSLLPIAKWGLHEISSYLSYGRGDMPQGVGIETISLCNRSCGYCPVGKKRFRETRDHASMDMKLYSKIIDDLAAAPRTKNGIGYNGNLFLVAFGEPVLDKQMAQRIKIAKDKLPEARVGLFSNGDLLTEEILNGWVDAGLDNVYVTPHDKDDPQPEHILELLKIEKFKKILVLGQPIRFFSNRAGTVDGIPMDQAIRPLKRCISNTYCTFISTDGKMTMCAHDAYIQNPTGNLNDENFWEIWDKKENKNTRKALRKGDWSKTPQMCEDCRTHFV